MEFIQTDINGITIIKPKVFGDARGFFMESYRESLFFEHGLPTHFVQDNVSRSSKGTLRGLHYQLAPHSQGKLVRASVGRVWDVAVDIRQGSPTFGKYIGVELSEDNQTMVYVPPGFAHGFIVLSDIAEFSYKCTEYYAPQAERSIKWDDPVINIQWPMEPDLTKISQKDSQAPFLADADINFSF